MEVYDLMMPTKEEEVVAMLMLWIVKLSKNPFSFCAKNPSKNLHIPLNFTTFKYDS